MTGTTIQNLRRAADVLQEELAQELGIRVGTLVEIEKNRVGQSQAWYREAKAAIDRVAARKEGV